MVEKIEMLVEALHTNEIGQKIVAVAMSYVGAPYQRHTHPHQPQSTEHGFDCSGFVISVLRACGIDLPQQARHSWELYNEIGRFISPEKISAGDLMLWHTNPHTKRNPNHASIYKGGGEIIHVTKGAGKVVITSLAYYTQELPVQLSGVKRVTMDD